MLTFSLLFSKFQQKYISLYGEHVGEKYNEENKTKRQGLLLGLS